MRTTIDFPDELLRQAKVRAALDGTTLKDLITSFVAEGLQRISQVTTERGERRRSALPVARAATGRPLPALTNAALHRILDEEESGRGRTD